MRANKARHGRGIWKAAASLAALLVITPAAAEIEGDNVTKGDLVSGVYSLRIVQEGRPTVNVWHDGNSYKTVTGDKNVMFHVDVRGVCRGLWRVKEMKVWANDQTKVSANSYIDHHVKLWTKIVGQNYKTTKVQSDVAIGGDLPSSAKKRYVKACNDLVDKRVSEGMSRAEALSKPAWLTGADYDPPLAGVINMRCYKGSLTAGQAHAWRDLDVAVRCRGSQGGTPAVPVAGGGTSLTAKNTITLVKAEVTPDDYAGKCPVDLFVTGQIDTSGGGAKLSYRWSHSGKLGPVKQTTTNANGSAHVSTSFEVKRPPKPNGGGNPQMKLLNPGQTQNGWVELHVLPQGKTDWSKAKTSNRSRWKVKCDPLPKRAKPPVTPKPGTAVLVPRTPAKKPNLMSNSGLTLNNKTAPWGGSLHVQANPAQFNNGRCGFRMRYDVTNNGQATASGYASRLTSDGAQIHQATNLNTPAGAKTVVSGTVYLKNGQHMLVASLDPQKTVDESNEGDNLYRIRVVVGGCRAQGRPNHGRPNHGQPQ